MKKLIFILVLIPFLGKAQNDTIKVDRQNRTEVTEEIKEEAQPLYIFDGKEVTIDQINKIDPEDIERIEILKNEKAIEKYGEKGKNGVIEIYSKFR